MEATRCIISSMSQLGLCPVDSDDQLLSEQTGMDCSYWCPTDSDHQDFVNIFPPELSDKLFHLLPIKDVMTCSKVSIGWRQVINSNSRWMTYCRRNRFMSKDPRILSRTETHVDPTTTTHRESPAFYLPQIASLRIEALCEWGVYFRQSVHLKRNWMKGYYVIHKMTHNQGNATENNENICTSAACNGKVLVIGTNSGKVMIWTVFGVPKLWKTMSEIKHPKQISHQNIQNGVENVKVNEVGYFGILYSIGLVRIYRLPENYDQNQDLELLCQVRICGVSNPIDGHTLIYQEIPETQTINTSSLIIPESIENLTGTTRPFVVEVEDPESYLHPSSNFGNDPTILDPGWEDSEIWLRDLIRMDPWFETDYQASDMIFVMNGEKLVISGWECNCFVVFQLDQSSPVRKVMIENGVQVSSKIYLTPNSLILTTRRNHGNQSQMDLNSSFHPTIALLCYELEEPFQYSEYLCSSSHRLLLDELQVDPENSERIVWVSGDSHIIGTNIKSGVDIFSKEIGSSTVENLLTSGPRIIYRTHDGVISCINWKGETIYEIESNYGTMGRLECHEAHLVARTEAMQVSVFNATTGRKYHTVYYQLGRIQEMFVYDTKIIIMGRQEPPVLIGYW